ncbi:type VII secretion integral membrane protein EccD [Nocardia beijingensis]|uniref:type VII secretion integral membrane protein EccD n=1 Tax=Nocardia beijingensis TaxID=95162 RepID=UPI00331B34B1
MCRVSVIGGNTQLDVGLPAAVPIAAFITDLVALIESRNPDMTESDDGVAPLRTRHYTLARIGQDAIAPSRTLSEAEVYDGEMLVLREASAKQSPALFDDVIDAVSRLTAVEFRSWSPSAARWTGLAVSVVAVVAALFALARSRSDGDGLAAPLLLAGFGLAAFAAAVIAAHRYSDELTATWLGLDGVLLLFSGAALFVPDSLGSPHLLLGFSVVVVAAVLGYRFTGAGATMFATTVTVAGLGAGAAAAQMIWDVALPKIAAGVLVAAIAGLSAVPRLAAALARLPVPPVPTAGAAIDPADHEPRPTIEGIGAIGATALPSAVGLGQRAKAANRFQSGMLAGCTIVAVAGALGAAAPLDAHRHWPGIALALVAMAVLCRRGRSFADLTQAAILITGGCVLGIGLGAGLALADSAGRLYAAGLLLLFAAAAAGFGVIGPHVEATPVTRRTGELFEYLLIISLIPLVLWVMDVYATARSL